MGGPERGQGNQRGVASRLPLGFVEVAIAFANARDVIFVAGAGNDGLDNDMLPTYPASYPVDNVVSVMATNEHDAKPGFSNYGKTTVHLAAPGVRILSTDCFLDSAAMASTAGPRLPQLLWHKRRRC